MEIPFQVDLRGKTAVVTGGGGVLCGGFARALAACGARVAILDLNEDMALGTAREIKEAGQDGLGIGANVLDKESMLAARDIVNREFGSCDILINGAGGNHPKGTTTREYFFPEDLGKEGELTTFFSLDPKSVDFVFNLNFLGTLIATQVFAQDMVAKEGAVIVNISSMNAFSPLTKIPAYSAAKAAVSNFTQWLAVHFSKVGIRVNAIAPGFFETNQNRALLFHADGSHTDRSKKILGMTPMGRFGRVEDLTGTLLWLVSEGGSGFVNGVVVPVDGGFAAYSGV